MTLIASDDRAYLTTGRSGRYALGPPEAPLIVLNDVDAYGCMWAADVPDGWDAPDVNTPMDRRQNGHGGYLGESSFEARPLTVEGTVTAPTPEALDAAYRRLLSSLLGQLSGFLRYTHLDENPAAMGLWVRPTGKPRWRALDDRLADFSFILVAEDPIKTGAALSVGPVRLQGTVREGGLVVPWAAVTTVASAPTVTTTRRNRVPNPAPASTTGWGGSYGTTGAGTTAYSASGGPGGGPYYRRSWTTAATVANQSQYADGRAASALPIPVTPGEVLSGSIQARTSWAASMRAALTFYDAAGATVAGGAAGATAVLVANTWTLLKVENLTVPAGATNVLLQAQGASTGTLPGIGATFDVGQALLETGAVAGAYFDGGTADTAALNYGWEGTAAASPSAEQTVTAGAVSAAGSTVGQVPNVGDEDAHARYVITGPVTQPIIQLLSGEYIHLTLTLGALDAATVDTAEGTVTMNGVNRYDAWGPGSTFPLIPPGGTEVRLRSYTGTVDPAAGLTVTTAPSWK